MQILEELEDQSERKRGIRSNKDNTKRNISFWVLEKERANTDKKEEKRKEEEEEKEEEEDHRYGYMSWVVWNYEYWYGI